MADRALHLSAIAIRDYRNLASVDLELPPTGAVLIGDNGQGKTNFLEAVYYLQLLRAMRGTRDQDLVRFGVDAFHVGATITHTSGARTIGVGFERISRKRRIRIDGVVVDRSSDAVGGLPSVMFSPSDVALITGEPAERRRFLDVALALTSRPYLVALQRYRAALVRRNRVLREGLRTGRVDVDAVMVWEPPLAEHGATLMGARRGWVDGNAARFADICQAMGEREIAGVQYVAGLRGPSSMAALAVALGEKRPLDLKRGITHVGPHRDNLLLTLGGRDTRAFGSAGQQRTAAIALRILEAETYRQRTGLAPIFLMDDPFAELDARRARRILDVLRGNGVGQTLLAVPRISDIPPGFDALGRLSVVGGAITPAP
jgi:DNA replication and repair protein RecF